MDAPPVQYVTTHDGIDIAYCVSGAGKPLVFMPQPMSHMQVLWTEDSWVRPWWQGLAERFRLVQYDGRGQGLSTRNLPAEVEASDLEEDLAAVVRRLRLEVFVLMAAQTAGHTAIRYAVEHSDQVEARILVSSMVSLADWPLLKLTAIAEQDWDGFLRMLVGLSKATDIASSVRRQRQYTTQADFLALSRLMSSSDVSAISHDSSHQPWFSTPENRSIHRGMKQ